MTLKTAVVAPMPRVIERIAVRARPGLFRSSRYENRRSCSRPRIYGPSKADQIPNLLDSASLDVQITLVSDSARLPHRAVHSRECKSHKRTCAPNVALW